MAIKFLKCRFKKDNYLQMNSINEFNIFKDIILFSKKEVYKEMKIILKNIDDKIDKQMAEAIEKYHIVMELKNQIDNTERNLSKFEEEININMNGTKESNIIARYSEKMLNRLLEEGFDSTDKDLERKAMTVTYSKRIMIKLDNLAKKDLIYNTNNEGGTDMSKEEYSKEAYDLFVKGSDEEIVDEVERVGEEAYDVLVKETEDEILRKNKDEEIVSQKAYNEYIKNDRKIKEVKDDESYTK